MFQLHKALSKLLTEQLLSERKRERERGKSTERAKESCWGWKRDSVLRPGNVLSASVLEKQNTFTAYLSLSHYLCLYTSLFLLLYLPSSISLLPGIVCCFNQSKLTLGVKFIKMEIFRLLRYCFCLYVAIASLRRLVSGRCLLASCGSNFKIINFKNR